MEQEIQSRFQYFDFDNRQALLHLGDDPQIFQAIKMRGQTPEMASGCRKVGKLVRDLRLVNATDLEKHTAIWNIQISQYLTDPSIPRTDKSVKSWKCTPIPPLDGWTNQHMHQSDSVVKY